MNYSSYGEITLALNHSPGNPRNSEGAFITLADGGIMFAYSRYQGSSGDDHGAAEIAARFSQDGGLSWSNHDTTLVANEGSCNVMSVSLLRLSDGRIALFYMRKNSFRDCRLRVRFSSDEAKSFGDPVLCIPAPGYFVVNNDRVIQLSSGRIVVPAAFHRSKLDTDEMTYDAFDSRALSLFFYSDDGGRTWNESADWWSIPVPSRSGLQEPGCIERAGGSLWAWFRTDTGTQWQSFSTDSGVTWAPPAPSQFASAVAPLSMKRLPGDGRLVAVWADPSRITEAPADSSWGRTPLVLATSRDDGRSWSEPVSIEADRQRGFCYTAIHPTENALLLAYCCGGRDGTVLQDSCIRLISYETLP